MGNNRIYEDHSHLLKRAQRIFLIVEIVFCFLVFYYWKVQILEHKKYWMLSEANRIKESVIPAPRGCITDRNDIILADNIGSFKTSIVRENSKNLEKSIEDISRLLGVETDVLRKRIARYASLPRFKPIVIKDNLTIDEVSRIEARTYELAELIVESEPRRYYPFGNLAAHVVGYLQELSEEEIKAGLFKEKNLGDLVGKTGLERVYESILEGVDGKRIEVVDSLGRPHEELSRVDPRQGQNLHLTLDFDLQQRAKELLEGREGAVAVMDPRSGEILALASYPTFDPNKFITRFTPEEWENFVNNPDRPLENRAIRGLYAPGSIFKLTMALAALDSGFITPQTSFFCSGTAQFYGRPFACWQKGGHGFVDLANAIRYSCNIYFYNLGRRMGIGKIAEYGEMLGFGRKTGIDLPGEKEGLVPSPAWKMKTKKASWYAGETISVSIGQGPLVITPLQVACETALIANRGVRKQPVLIKPELKDKGEGKGHGSSEDGTRIRIPPQTFEKVIEGMWRSVNEEGTGRGARIEGFDVCGKTGSTQLIGKEAAERLKKEIKTHSWFTGFAPRNNPKVVVTVLVEFGGMGGATAAPVAKELFGLYKKKHDR